MTDPVSDLIIRIKNAALAHKTEVAVPYSKMRYAIVAILEKEGYVSQVRQEPDGTHTQLVCALKYVGRDPLITNVKVLSTPGRRLYAGANAIPTTLGGYGVTIISTNKGVMGDKQARQLGVGGELLCQVW